MMKARIMKKGMVKEKTSRKVVKEEWIRTGSDFMLQEMEVSF